MTIKKVLICNRCKKTITVAKLPKTWATITLKLRINLKQKKSDICPKCLKAHEAFMKGTK